MSSFHDVRDSFLDAATWHGNLTLADALLSKHPQLAASDIHTAAVVGDDAAVRRFLQQDVGNATARSGPFAADALTYLGLSKYLRLDRTRTPASLRAATALLDAGAPAQTGFWNKGEFETALYGAAGVAHHAGLTRLLLEHGADPNDDEAVYHSPESHDNSAMAVLVESGRVTPVNLAVARGGETAIEQAARRGRNDLLNLFEKRGYPIQMHGALELIAACARQDSAAVRSISESRPELVSEVLAQGGTLLAEFAGCADGVAALLGAGATVEGLRYPSGYAEVDALLQQHGAHV